MPDQARLSGDNGGAYK